MQHLPHLVLLPCLQSLPHHQHLLQVTMMIMTNIREVEAGNTILTVTDAITIMKTTVILLHPIATAIPHLHLRLRRGHPLHPRHLLLHPAAAAAVIPIHPHPLLMMTQLQLEQLLQARALAAARSTDVIASAHLSIHGVIHHALLLCLMVDRLLLALMTTTRRRMATCM